MISIFRIALGKIRGFFGHEAHQHGAQSIAHRVCARVAPSMLALTATIFVLAAARPFRKGPPPAAFGQESLPTDTEPVTPSLKPKQKQAILKSNFEKMKRDAEDLNALAKSLKEEIDKSNENVLSLKVVEKAEKIEKLARKIKDVAKGA
jgi:hypothetical protein